MMSNVREEQALKKALIRLVAEGADEIRKMFPKLDVGSENYPLFVGKVLMDKTYFYFRCRLTKEGRGAVDRLRRDYSNGHIQVLANGTIEIAINDRARLRAFLGPANTYIEEGGAQLIK